MNVHQGNYTTSPGVFYAYVRRIMVHEFGHTLGLHDFYDDKKMDHSNPVMNTSYEISDEDIEQLEAMYFHHDSH